MGVSLVNKVPEELVFVTLSGIRVHFTRTAANEVLEVSIQRIQVSGRQQSEAAPVPAAGRAEATGPMCCYEATAVSTFLPSHSGLVPLRRWTTSCWAPPSP